MHSWKQGNGKPKIQISYNCTLYLERRKMINLKAARMWHWFSVLINTKILHHKATSFLRKFKFLTTEPISKHSLSINCCCNVPTEFIQIDSSLMLLSNVSCILETPAKSSFCSDKPTTSHDGAQKNSNSVINCWQSDCFWVSFDVSKLRKFWHLSQKMWTAST